TPIVPTIPIVVVVISIVIVVPVVHVVFHLSDDLGNDILQLLRNDGSDVGLPIFVVVSLCSNHSD
ncbi:hypothetical protein Tco_0258531, partial [Tanacetum coccineum]